MAEKKFQIRNSTAEFLIFTSQASENTIEVMVQDETVWLTQKMIAALFEVEVNTINYHLKEIFNSGELQQSATIRNFRIVQTEGKREVSPQAERNIPMTMKDWAGKLNAFLQFNEKDILTNSGKVTQAIAKSFAESEFEKYRIVQDKLFESDFDKAIKKLEEPQKKIEE